MKVGDKVSIGFNAVTPEELERLKTETRANVLRKNPTSTFQYKQSNNQQTEAQTGCIESIVEYVDDQHKVHIQYFVRVNMKNGPKRLRMIDPAILTVITEPIPEPALELELESAPELEQEQEPIPHTGIAF